MDSIITRFISEEIEHFSINKLIDFLPDIQLPKDQIVLDNWIKYFKERKIPFFITRKKGKLTLWKTREVVLMKNYK